MNIENLSFSLEENNSNDNKIITEADLMCDIENII